MHESHHDGYITPHFPNMAPKLANFAFKLYRELARQSDNKNIVFTAVSIATAFAMPSLGAKGDARTEIMKALGYNSKKALNADVHGGVHHLLDISIRQDGQFQLTHILPLFPISCLSMDTSFYLFEVLVSRL